MFIIIFSKMENLLEISCQFYEKYLKKMQRKMPRRFYT